VKREIDKDTIQFRYSGDIARNVIIPYSLHCRITKLDRVEFILTSNVIFYSVVNSTISALCATQTDFSFFLPLDTQLYSGTNIYYFIIKRKSTFMVTKQL
jgi:hypothetical protein